MNIAVIPARGGSKRIPRKNIRLFNGQPMIAWSIQAARDSGLFDHIVISTDDREIAKIAQAFGAEVPFLRPSSLADDVTPTVPVIAHAVSACAEMGWAADHVCCLYPCAPFIQAEDLLAGLELLKKTKAEYVYPVAEYAHPVHRAMLQQARQRIVWHGQQIDCICISHCLHDRRGGRSAARLLQAASARGTRSPTD